VYFFIYWVELKQKSEAVIEKTMNVAITKCYGNADEKSRRGKFNISKGILTDMVIKEDSNTIILKYDENIIVLL
jgi:hypothetical protein